MVTYNEVYTYVNELESKANAFIDKLGLPSFIADRQWRIYENSFSMELYDRDGDLRGHIDFIVSPATKTIDFKNIEILLDFDIVNT